MVGRWTNAAILASVAVLALPALGMAVPMLSAGPLHFAPALRHSTVQSTNWAGWAVTGPKGSVTDVKGSWVVPAVTGCTAGTHTYSSFWVGIDGYSSGTVEQTGTDSDCNGATPQYYAWFEFYPKPSHLISGLTITPGDVISAEVTHSGSKFIAKITDVTTGASFKTSATVRAQQTSAEWIAEAPSSSGGILPLADFGTVYFGIDNTQVSATDTATVSGTTSGIGNFSTAVSINMVSTSSSTTVKASTSALSTDQTSFSVVWKSAGP